MLKLTRVVGREIRSFSMQIEQGVVEVTRVDGRQGVEIVLPEENTKGLDSRPPVMLAVPPGVLVLTLTVMVALAVYELP
jgi:hypothetical protein